MNLLDATTEFHLKAELPTGEWAELGHGETTMDGNMPMALLDWNRLRKLRIKLLAEEYAEYQQGEQQGDIVEIVDGLLDIIVIAWGTLLAYVGPARAEAAANEVARSNLEKVDGEIKRRADGKILKPEGWMPPDIERALING